MENGGRSKHREEKKGMLNDHPQRVQEGNEKSLGRDEATAARLIPSWRLTLSVTGFLGCVVLYLQRINMSLAIICMTNYTALVENMNTSATVTYNISNSNVTATVTEETSSHCLVDQVQQRQSQGEFIWDRNQRGLILSSFFIGYVTTQVPGGWLAGKVGGKWVLGGGMTMLTVGSLLTPVAARTNPYFLMAVRIMEGVGSGVYFPANHAIWSEWAPPAERSRLVTLVISGNSLGTIVTYITTGLLCEYGFDNGWGSVFYVHGLMSVVWLVAWLLIAADRPSKNRWISHKEELYIRTSLGRTKLARPPAPWLRILTSPPVWAIILSQMASGWITGTALTTLPSYMKEVLKFNIKANGLYNSLPPLCQWVCTLLGAIIADCLIFRKILSVNLTRKLMVCLGLLLPSILVIIVSYLDCSQRLLAVALLSVGVGVWGFGRSGHLCNMLDIAPRYGAELMGISNFVANITSILTPIVASALTPNGAPEEWRRVFFVCAGLGAFGTLVFLVFSSGEPQDWAMSKGSNRHNDEPDHRQIYNSQGDADGSVKCSSDSDTDEQECAL